MHKIGKGVRPEDLEPATGNPRGQPIKYPVGKLEPGEHFAVGLPDKDKLTRKRKVQTLQHSISNFRKKAPDRKFTVRYSQKENALYVIRTDGEAS